MKTMVLTYAILWGVLFCGGVFQTSEGMQTVQNSYEECENECARKLCHFTPKKVFETIGEACWDVVRLNANLISWDSYRLLATFFPPFVVTRMIDEPLQSCFYHPCNHKNVNQLPHWAHRVAQWSIGVPIVVLGTQAFISSDYELAQTSYAYLLGLPFVIWTKELIKKIPFTANLRPWNEYFGRCQRSYGGFPSGHMAEATYVAVLFGKRFGPRYGVPLGILAGGLAAAFLSCNRHYLSQLLAGAATGTIYAFAADKLVDDRLKDLFDVELVCSGDCGPGVKISYTF